MANKVKYYGVVGTNQLSAGGHPNDEQEWIEVAEKRPSVNEVLQADGTWLLDASLEYETSLKSIAEEANVPLWFIEHIIYDHGGKTDIVSLQEFVDKYLAKEKPE